MIIKNLLIEQFNKLMQDISEVRRHNLLLLRQQAEKAFFEDAANFGLKYYDKMFVKYIGISLSLYSQLKNPDVRPNFSEKHARGIETNVKMSHGWFDEDHTGKNIKLIKLSGDQCIRAITIYNEFMKDPKYNFTDEAKLKDIAEKLILHLSIHRDISPEEFASFLA